MFARSIHKIIENDNIYLRKFVLSDDVFMFQLMNQQGWLTHIGDRNIHKRTAARTYLKTGPIRTYKQHEFGLYMIVGKKDGQPLGTCGLMQRSYLNAPDLGFAISEEFYRMGIAYEAALLVMQHAKQNLAIRSLYATTRKGNIASQRLLHKLGFSNKGESIVATDYEPDEKVSLFKINL